MSYTGVSRSLLLYQYQQQQQQQRQYSSHLIPHNEFRPLGRSLYGLQHLLPSPSSAVLSSELSRARLPSPWESRLSLLGAHPQSLKSACSLGLKRDNAYHTAGGGGGSQASPISVRSYFSAGRGGYSIPASRISDKETKHGPTLHHLIEETRKLHDLWRAGAADRLRKERNAQKQQPSLKRQREPKETSTSKHSKILLENATKQKVSKLPNTDMFDVQENSGPTAVQIDWNESAIRSKVDHAPLTEEEKEEYLSLELHQHVRGDVTEFIDNCSENEFSDEDYDSDFTHGSDDGLHCTCAQAASSVKTREAQAYDFFINLFEKNEELLKFYKKHCNSGKFQCLVCFGVAKKGKKNYTGLVSMFMHANTIKRTKLCAEHRGFGRAVCALLGWDPNKTPTLPVEQSIKPRACLPINDQETVSTMDQERQATDVQSADYKNVTGHSWDKQKCLEQQDESDGASEKQMSAHKEESSYNDNGGKEEDDLEGS